MSSLSLEERRRRAQVLVDTVHYLDGFEMLIGTIYQDRFEGGFLIHPQRRRECEATIWQLLDRFSVSEFNTIVLRFGLLNNRIVTLKEAARVLGVSTERVRQLEAQVLRRLAQPSCRKELEVFIKEVQPTSPLSVT